jgi:hypothetical protein
MTLTSTGPSGSHLKPVVAVFAVAAIAAGALAIAQVIGTDSPRTTPAPAAVSTEAVEPYNGPSGLERALAEGKLDGGFTLQSSETFAGSEPAPEVVVIAGQGSLYDALIAGKYDGDFPGAPDVQYVLSSETAIGTSSQLVEGLGDLPFVRLSDVGTGGVVVTTGGSVTTGPPAPRRCR